MNRRLSGSLGILLFLSAAHGPAAQGLSAPEQKMRDYVRAHTDEEIAFLRKVVDINSGTMNFAGVRAVGDEFAKELTALGFQSRWVMLPDSVKRAGHLVAEYHGRRPVKGGKRLLLLGHLDTVFEGEGQKFAMVDDSTAGGAGTSDMKGGDVAILYALKAMKSTGVLDRTNIIVVLMGDEESGGEPQSVSRAALVEAAKRSNAALAFEEDAGKATVARRGWSSWRIKVTARQSHSQGIFSPGSGYGAIFDVARILDGFRTAMAGEQYLTFNPGVILGGATVKYDTTLTSGTAAGKLNIIAPTAEVHGDLRFLTPEQLEKARTRMREIVARNLPGTSAEIFFSEANPPMQPTKGNYALLAKLDQVTRALGLGPTEALDPGQRGAGDISYIAQYLDALDGLGVRGARAHTPEETVNLKSVPIATERAAALIYRLSYAK